MMKLLTATGKDEARINGKISAYNSAMKLFLIFDQCKNKAGSTETLKHLNILLLQKNINKRVFLIPFS